VPNVRSPTPRAQSGRDIRAGPRHIPVFDVCAGSDICTTVLAALGNWGFMRLASWHDDHFWRPARRS